MQKTLKIFRLSFLELSILFIIGYFAFEYKPFEHRLYHVISKIFFHSPAYQLSKDLNIYLTDIIIFICFISFLITAKKKTSLIFQNENKYLWIVFIFSLFSVLFSKTANLSHSLLKIHQLFFSVLLFIFTASVIAKNDPSNFLRKIFFLLALIGTVESFIGLYHYLLQHPLGLYKLGEPKFKSNINYAMIPTGGKVWIFNLFKTAKTSIFRAHGTFPHPNILGAFLSISMLSTLYAVLEKKRWEKGFFILMFFLQSTCLIVTFSRSAIFGFFISSIFFLTFAKIKLKKTIFLIMLLIGASFLFNGYIFYPQVNNRGGIVSNSELSNGSNNARIYYSLIALNMMKSHPILGVGYDQFIPNSNAYLGTIAYDSSLSGATVHNIYLLLGAETGIMSLCSFLLFLFFIFKESLKSITLEKLLLISFMVGFLFIGLCDYFFLFFQQGKIMFFGLLGILAGYNRFTNKLKSYSSLKEPLKEIINSES
ncbi:MAG: O-antigen ligase family protein [Chlamydiota bacterium]|jgi:O-antigen ligase